MEHDAEGPIQTLREDLGTCRQVSGRVGGEDQDASAPAFGHEDVAVRGDPDDAGLVQAGGEYLHGEALRHIRHRPLRRIDNLRHSLEIRRFGVAATPRRRQVGGPDVKADARGVALPAATGIGSGTDLLSVHRRQQNECQWKTCQHRLCAHKFLPEVAFPFILPWAVLITAAAGKRFRGTRTQHLHL